MSLFQKQTIPLAASGLLNPLVKAYLEGASTTDPLYRFPPTHAGLLACQENYASSFTSQQRQLLAQQLILQAKVVSNTSDSSLLNIERLKESNTFTITTGHQLCLFTGPLYFVYKILSVINACEQLQHQNPQQQYVPVYWMASEDHDLEEIQSVNVFGKTLKWETNQTGAVGAMQTLGIEQTLQALKTILSDTPHTQTLLQILEQAYLEHTNLSTATRYLVNALFGKYGLVVIDGNDAVLKQQFIPELERDLFLKDAQQHVNTTIETLEAKHFPIQVKPRAINVFYMRPGLRARIEEHEDGFQVVNTSIKFTKHELKELLYQSPEQFSPNVVLRPLYQQKLLPNIAYVGGPGELSYWLEYKTLFEANQGIMPVLLPRHFVSLVDATTLRKIEKLNLSLAQFFNSEQEIIQQFLQTHESVFDLKHDAVQLAKLFDSIATKVETIDKSLGGTVGAERQKSLNALDLISAKVNKSLKQKSEQEIKQIQAVKNRMFPNGIPQERFDNFLQYASHTGLAWVDEMKWALESGIPVNAVLILT